MVIREDISLNFVPLVSVCIPTYNGAEFINEALDSCKNQDYPNLELVISDDQSTDGSLEIINRKTKMFPFEVRIYNHEPSGIGANWNNCIRNSKGKYIKFLFQDDILDSTCISELVKLIECEPNVALVSCKRSFLINKNQIVDENWIRRYENLQINLKQNSNDFWRLTSDNFNFSFFYEGTRNKIGEPTCVLIRKDLLDKVGRFREDLKQNLDFECWWRLLENYTILIMPKKLVSFRIHNNQATSHNKGKQLPDYRIIRKLILSKYVWKMSFQEARKVIVKEIFILWKGVKMRLKG